MSFPDVMRCSTELVFKKNYLKIMAKVKISGQQHFIKVLFEAINSMLHIKTFIPKTILTPVTFILYGVIITVTILK